MSFAASEGKSGQTGQSGQNTGNRGQTGTGGRGGRPTGQAAGNQAVESLTDRLYQMYMLQLSSASPVSVSEEKKRERLLDIIDYVMPETEADVYQGSAEEGTRGTSPRVREKTYSKEELDAAEAFKKEQRKRAPCPAAAAADRF